MSSSLYSLPRVAAQTQQQQQRATAHILLYTATAGFRHDSIPTAIQALQNQSRESGGNFSIRFDATEDSGRFRDDVLEGYDAVMFVSTTGEGTYTFSSIIFLRILFLLTLLNVRSA